MIEPRALDASLLSEFVTKMRDVFRRRLAAVDPRDAKAVELEMVALMRTYLGRDAWEATAAGERDLDDALTAAGIPRATGRRRARPGPPSTYPRDFDHKLAQAGDRDED